MTDEKPAVTHHGGSAGSTYESGYAVDYTSALAATSTTSTDATPLTTLGTTVEEAFDAAKGALPTTFAEAGPLLETLKTSHVRDVNRTSTYVGNCVTAAQSCLAAYENATAEQVAETARFQTKLDFDHSGLFGLTENRVAGAADKKFTGVENAVNDRLPEPITPDGSSSSTSKSYAFGDGGVTKHSTTTTENQTTTTQTSTTSTTGGRYTQESTVEAQTRGGNSTTVYNGSSHNISDGGDERTASGVRVTGSRADGRPELVNNGETSLPTGAP